MVKVTVEPPKIQDAFETTVLKACVIRLLHRNFYEGQQELSEPYDSTVICDTGRFWRVNYPYGSEIKISWSQWQPLYPKHLMAERPKLVSSSS